MQKYKNREEVPTKYKWDLTEYFKTEKEFNDLYQQTLKDIKTIKEKTDCFNSAGFLKEFLDLYFYILKNCYNLNAYSYLKNDEVLGIKENIERLNKVDILFNEFSLSTAFFEPNLLKLDDDTFNKLVNDSILKNYKFCLQDIYKYKKHTLTEKEEQIISDLVSSVNHFEEISSVMLNSEHNYGKVKKTKEIIAVSNVRSLLKNDDEKIRKEVYKKFHKKLDEYSKTNASLLNCYVSLNNKIAKIRNYKSSWDKKLFNLNLTNKVYEALTSSVEENLDSIHRYYDLKRNILKKDKLNVYDLSLELSKSKKKYSIEDAQEILLKALKPLGEDYLNHFKKIFDNHYVDYCQYKGKCSGGYSLSTMDINSRILMSFNYDFDSISTLAHEGGHNVHHQYVCENNLIHYRDVPNIIAEVASLTNEFLLSDYMYKNGSKEEKLIGLSNALGVIVSNLFGAVREGKIEQDFYKYNLDGNIITKEYLDKLSYDSLIKYYGNSVKTNKSIKDSWVTRSHYYMNFYLYCYSICVSVASYVAKNISIGNKEMLDKYLKFLKTGTEKYPMDVFKILGIDLENKDVYVNAIKYFDELIDEYKKVEKEV